LIDEKLSVTVHGVKMRFSSCFRAFNPEKWRNSGIKIR